MMFLLRELGYITFVIRRPDGSDAAVFTLHRAEANSLATRIQELIAGADGENTLVEGVFLGGPPRRDQLLPPDGTAGTR
jgi:hypothetical protein